jgi:hypothetical protein
MKTILIDSDRQKTYAKSLIDEMAIDGSFTVETKKTAMDSTAKQRRLQWMWYHEISISGLGQDDNKDDVHIRMKWKFARPILLRDDEMFGIVYGAFIKTVEGSELYGKYCKVFSEQYISTESMTRTQRAEYLTEVQGYWIMKGVELTIPDDYGKNLLRFKPKQEVQK